jgi:predicted TIM-barrel fold metal-dependent hydrolase
VRINLRTRSQSLSGADAWEKLLLQYAERLRRLGWAIQIFVSMDQIADIRPVISKLGLCSGDDRNGLKVVFDHLGHPEAGKVDQQTGCSDLYKILQENRHGAFVKLSGTFRLTESHNLETHIKKLLEIAPDQVVWGSDWPHTAGPEHNPHGDPMAVQDFLTPNMPQFIQDCVGWCSGDPALMKKIWVDNPRRLWDYSGDD